MQNVLDITKALADENRIRALMMLRNGELCVCQIIEMLNLAPSTVSKHMSILRQARIVAGRKEGRWMHYRLVGPEESNAAKDAIDWLEKHLKNSPAIQNDRKKLKTIVKKDKVELCRKQNQK